VDELGHKKLQERGIMTSYLTNKRCYLSGPIENDSVGLNWRIEPKKVLKGVFGLNLFDPFEDPKQQWVPALKEARQNRDFDTMATIAKKFVHKDLAMTDRSDMLIAYLPYKVPTTGTTHEIINSANAKKPVLLVCERKELIPLWFYGFIPCDMMFDGWNNLYDYLHEVNEGKHMENSKWSFIYGLI
jgi:hypothetical protein